mmetsp:Transcript_33393/g.70192  ORF Transcript_33393/g.70192 Transcript_33393/m.70192 type:complete len:156 (+) Transcript_33393:375-842(+)
MTDDNVPRYNEIESTMNVSYYTHGGYSKCLAGKKLVFIGDSRVRYQYMHLVSYLKNKRFMKCSDQSQYQHVDNENEDECILINEKLSDQNLGWKHRYNVSTAMLNMTTLRVCATVTALPLNLYPLTHMRTGSQKQRLNMEILNSSISRPIKMIFG